MQKRILRTLRAIGLLLIVASCAPVNPTSTPQGVATPTLNVRDLISDPSTMKGCQEISNLVVTTQPSYRGALPGSTNQDKVRDLLGSPKQVSTYDQSWGYGNLRVYFLKDIVDEILVHADDPNMKALGEVIKAFGCPTMIYAVDGSEDPSGNYDMTYLIYNQIGIEFRFSNFPVSITETSDTIRYFRPQSLDEYLELMRPVFGIANKARPVSWEDAVKAK